MFLARDPRLHEKPRQVCVRHVRQGTTKHKDTTWGGAMPTTGLQLNVGARLRFVL